MTMLQGAADLLGLYRDCLVAALWGSPVAYALCLASALTVALLLYWFRDAAPDERTLAHFWRHVAPRSVYAHPSARLDVAFLLVDAAVRRLFVLPWIASSLAVAGLVSGALSHLSPPSSLPVDATSRVLLTLALVVVTDLAFYVSHRLQHRVAWLWAFHRVHHTAEVLTPLTAHRQHPIDQLVDGSLVGIAAGAVYGAFGHLHAGVVDPVFVLGHNAVAFAFHFAGSHLRHSHVSLSYGPVLDRILVSPAHHQIHHSADPRHHGRNLGGIFALWDRWGGTLVVPARGTRLRFGTGDAPATETRSGPTSVWGLYLEPFGQVAARGFATAGRTAAPAAEEHR